MATIEELKAQERKLSKLLSEVRKLTAGRKHDGDQGHAHTDRVALRSRTIHAAAAGIDRETGD